MPNPIDTRDSDLKLKQVQKNFKANDPGMTNAQAVTAFSNIEAAGYTANGGVDPLEVDNNYVEIKAALLAFTTMGDSIRGS